LRRFKWHRVAITALNIAGAADGTQDVKNFDL